MTWIDDRLAERERLKARQLLIAEKAEQIYEELWDEIVKFLEEAKSKGMSLFTNGSPGERVVRLSVLPMARELHINLARDRSSISTEGVNISIDVCEGDVVCLKHKGDRVNMRGAAMLILDPFLFPDLIKPSGSKSGPQV